jgi:predicted O-methyltransferase YrrM
MGWEYFKTIERLLANGQHDAALALLNRRGGAPDRAKIPFFLLAARAHAAAGALDKAIATLHRFEDSGISDFWAHYGLANYYRDLGCIEKTYHHYRKAHSSAGWTESDENGYRFTHDYFSGRIEDWNRRFAEVITKAPICCLEVGSWQGGSALWLLDKVVSRRGGSLTCIDSFAGSSEHAAFLRLIDESIESFFDDNIRRSGHAAQCRKLKGYSQQVLPTLIGSQFDFIYIDGAHQAKFVIQDAILAWPLLSNGGYLLFDDVDFSFPEAPAQNTERALDFFQSVFAEDIEVLERSPQLLLRRTK